MMGSFCRFQVTITWGAAALLLAHTAVAEGAPQTRFYLLNHSGTNYGINLVLKSQADTNGICPLASVNIELAMGENIASGLVDVTDRPKYDLVNKVRTANLTAWKSLGLLGPQIITTDRAFGVVSNVFGFNRSGQPSLTVVVERSSDLNNWRPMQTNTLAGGVLYFSDTSVRRNMQRFYRARYQ